MSFDWASVGNTITGLTTALANAGVAPGTSAFQSIMAQIGLAGNPNRTDELATCAQLLQLGPLLATNPAMEGALVQHLVMDKGIPASAAAVALQLMQPGVDVTAKVLQIEQLINQGG